MEKKKAGLKKKKIVFVFLLVSFVCSRQGELGIISHFKVSKG